MLEEVEEVESVGMKETDAQLSGWPVYPCSTFYQHI